jgi:hypothetical protein
MSSFTKAYVLHVYALFWNYGPSVPVTDYFQNIIRRSIFVQ